MHYRKLGRTGLKVSEISLGTMAFGRWIDEKASAAVLDQALDAGNNLIVGAQPFLAFRRPFSALPSRSILPTRCSSRVSG